MQHRAHPHRIVLLSSSFRHPERWLLFTRARLFPDRIELYGWAPGAPYDNVLYLDSIRRITWDTTAEDANVVFHLDDGTTLALQLPTPDQWRHTLEKRLNWMPRDRRPRPARFNQMGMEDLIAYTSSMS